MQVIAWIMGEYGSDIEEKDKLEQIIEELCSQAYIGYEQSETIGLIVSALAKLHHSVDYAPHPLLERVMEDFNNSKHLDVQ